MAWDSHCSKVTEGLCFRHETITTLLIGYGESHSVGSDSVTPWTVAYQALPPWDFPGKSTGVGCHFLLQEIFPTQGLNPGLLHCRLYRFTV